MGVFRLLTAALACCALSLGSASAQRLSNPEGRVGNFRPEVLMPLLQEMGGKTELVSLGGRPTVGVIMPSGAKFLMTPTACDAESERCVGVSIRGLFDGGGTPAAVINRFNQQGTVPKAVLENSTVILYHYIVADFGARRGNIDIHVGLMENAIGRYQQFLTSGRGQAQSVSLAAETRHAGTTPLLVGQHAGAVVLHDLPRDYIN